MSRDFVLEQNRDFKLIEERPESNSLSYYDEDEKLSHLKYHFRLHTNSLVINSSICFKR